MGPGLTRKIAFLFLNHPKLVLHWYCRGSISTGPYVFCVYALLKDDSHYDLSVRSM